jgi:hypothetical protein
MSEILKPTAYSCTNVEHVVVLNIGGKELQMDAHTALRMAAMLSHSGRQAKIYMGDGGFSIYGFGTLTDANADALEVQKRRDGTVTFSNNRV